MSKKVIVTGCTGQDGSYMVDFLLSNTDHLIYGMIRRTAKPDYSNLKEALKNPRFKTVVGDLSDGHSIDSLVKEIKPDYFLNFAAQSFVGSSWKIPEQTFDIDAIGVIRCLEAIRKHVPCCRFYNAGSSEEMGDVQYSPQDENHPARARSPYGAAKIASRQITKVYRESYNLYAIQGLLYNHESERRGEEFVTRKITKGVARIKIVLDIIKAQKKLNNNSNWTMEFEPIVLGNLEAKRDWSYAPDFIDGIWKMMNQEQYRNDLKFFTPSPVFKTSDDCKFWSKHIKEYILSSGETHSIREFIELSFKRAGIEIEDCNPERLPPTEENPHNGRQINYQTKDGKPLIVVSREFYRPAEIDLLLGNSSLARRELGWQPKVSFNELVNKMTDHDLLNP